MRIIRYADLVAEPWRNGGGVTRVICAAGTGTDFDWRISIAEVACAGPFSRFEGVDRTLVLLDGAAMALTIDGAPETLTPAAPIARFAGEGEVSAALPHGPTRDFNVMSRRAACRHSAVLADGRVRAAAGEVLVVLALGEQRLGGVTLGRLDCVIADDGELALTGPSVVVRIAGIRADT